MFQDSKEQQQPSTEKADENQCLSLTLSSDDSFLNIQTRPLNTNNNSTINSNNVKLQRIPSERRVEFSIGSSKLLDSTKQQQLQPRIRPKSALKRYYGDKNK